MLPLDSQFELPSVFSEWVILFFTFQFLVLVLLSQIILIKKIVMEGWDLSDSCCQIILINDYFHFDKINFSSRFNNMRQNNSLLLTFVHLYNSLGYLFLVYSF